MNLGKVSLKGIEAIVSFLTPWLKVPEERYRLRAEAEAKLSEAGKTKSEAITNALKEIAETRALELNNLQHAIGLYEKIGYSAEKIQQLVGPQLHKLLQTHDDLLALKQLAEEGVILDAKVRKPAVYQERLTMRGTDWQAET